MGALVQLPMQSVPPMDTGSNLFTIAWYLALRGMANATNAPTSSTLSVQQTTVVGAMTNPITASVAPVLNGLLCVILTQDGTGGGQITWSSDFLDATVNIGTNPGDRNVFLFLGWANPATGATVWLAITLPMLGQNP